MLYLLHGTNKDQAREKASDLLETLQQKKPDAAVFKFDADKWNQAFFDELIGGQGLFERKYIVFFNTVLEAKEIKEYVVDALKEIAASENIFIFLEGKMDKATLTKFEKLAAKVQEFGKEEAKKKSWGGEAGFNIFSLTDAFGRRDKKNLWVLYRESVEEEVAPEEVHGILFWQLKAMLSAAEAQSAKASGLAPFVFSKAQGFLRNFKPEELKDLSKKLIALYSDARRGKVEFEIGLEQFILNL